MNVNLNQLKQSVVRGKLDLDIMRSGVLQGKVSASQATALKPGDAVTLDNVAGDNIFSFIATNESTECIGHVVYDEKKSSPVAGDFIQVALNVQGVVMWMIAGGNITAATAVEQQSDGDVQTLSAGKKRGIALDAGTDQLLIRVLLFKTVSA